MEDSSAEESSAEESSAHPTRTPTPHHQIDLRPTDRHPTDLHPTLSPQVTLSLARLLDAPTTRAHLTFSELRLILSPLTELATTPPSTGSSGGAAPSASISSAQLHAMQLCGTCLVSLCRTW